MQPLSDGTKKFMLYSAVLLVAVCNIVFGLYSMSGPPAKPAAATRAPPVAAVQSAPGYPGNVQTEGNAPAAVPNDAPSAKAAGRPTRPLAQAAGQAAGQVAADGAPAKCDVDACTAAYFSFRASDCTYMPTGGGRRLCTKGNPPQ
jgi:BA14K-like protein